MLYWHVLSLLVSIVISAPLESGQPGGPWTEQEIDIVRAKVLVNFVIFKWQYESMSPQSNGSMLYCLSGENLLHTHKIPHLTLSNLQLGACIKFHTELAAQIIPTTPSLGKD